jgi:fructose-bisphosphate aldolase class II
LYFQNRSKRRFAEERRYFKKGKNMEKLKFYLKEAQKTKKAIGQFNFSTLEQLKGILMAGKKLNCPLILGTSEREAKFFGIKEAVLLRDLYRKELKIPIFLNLDHGKDIGLIKKAIDFGYDGVHFDGSSLSLKENIILTRKIVSYARKKGIIVEGEVGKIETESSKIYKRKFIIKEKDLTDPREAEEFVKKTKVDSLAINIGNFHGIEVSGLNPKLRIERLKEIKKRVGETFLVLHGGSGIRERDIKEAIKNGISKININTELRLAFSFSIKEFFKKHPQEIVPYKILPQAIEGVQKVVEKKIKTFTSL